MTFAEDTAVVVNDRNSENPATFKFQAQRRADPFASIRTGIEFDGAFDPVKAGNRKAGAFHHALEPPDTILNLLQDDAILHQLTDS